MILVISTSFRALVVYLPLTLAESNLKNHRPSISATYIERTAWYLTLKQRSKPPAVVSLRTGITGGVEGVSMARVGPLGEKTEDVDEIHKSCPRRLRRYVRSYKPIGLLISAKCRDRQPTAAGA